MIEYRHRLTPKLYFHLIELGRPLWMLWAPSSYSLDCLLQYMLVSCATPPPARDRNVCGGIGKLDNSSFIIVISLCLLGMHTHMIQCSKSVLYISYYQYQQGKSYPNSKLPHCLYNLCTHICTYNLQLSVYRSKIDTKGSRYVQIQTILLNPRSDSLLSKSTSV